MRTVTYKLEDLKTKVIHIGKVAENDATRVQIDAGSVFAEYPAAVPTMSMINPDGTAFPVSVERSGDLVLWDVKDSELAAEGQGEIQFTFTDGNTVAKSVVGRVQICRSIVGNGEAPDPIQDWMTEADAALEEIENISATAETLSAGSQATASYADGVLSFGIPQGAQGAPGQDGQDGADGQDGEDGVSPTVAVTEITGGHTVTITDAQGDHAFNVMDGTAGAVIDDTSTASDKVWSASKTNELKSAFDLLPEEKNSTKHDVDLDVSDAEGNVLVRFKDGHIRTKKFDSNDQNISIRKTSADADLDIVDAGGNVILRLKDGYIQTKKFDSTDEFELPERYKEYMDAKVARINELMLAAGGNGDAFIFLTDEHWTLNAKQSPKLVNYIRKHTKIDKLFAGGDLINGGSDEYADLFRRAIGGRCYRCNGNHDYIGGTEKELAYMYESSWDDEHGNPMRRYFYVDNPKHKVRYVLLNDFAEDDGTWTWGYEAEQMTWMQNVAFDVDEGWTIFVITHMFWKNVSESTTELTLASREEDVLDLIDAYNGNGTIACILQGHTHLDALKTTTGGIPIIITGSDKYLPAQSGNEAWLKNRELGTTTEQCFDVCVWNGDTKTITAVRIGGFATGDDEDDAELIEIGERTVTYGEGE